MNLRCHLCHQQMTQVAYCNWRLGKRREVNFTCTNLGCLDVNPLSTMMSIVLPEEEISAYSVSIKHKDIWYEITAQNSQTTLNKLTHHYSINIRKEDIITLDRFIELNPHLELKPQIQQIFDKLHSLVIFL